MSSKGLGEMFEGDSADMCARKVLLVLMGPSGGSTEHRPRSEDRHGHERKLTTGPDGRAGWRLEESKLRLTQPSFGTGQELGNVLIPPL